MVKRTKRHHRVVRKGEAKSQARRPRRTNQRSRKPSTDAMPEEEKFTYEGTFTQQVDEL